MYTSTISIYIPICLMLKYHVNAINPYTNNFFIKQQILNRGIRCVHIIYIYKPNLINLFWLWFTIRISTWQKGSCRTHLNTANCSIQRPHFRKFSSNSLWTCSTASGALRSNIRSPTKSVVQSWALRVGSGEMHGDGWNMENAREPLQTIVQNLFKTCKTTKTYKKQTTKNNRKQQDINPFNLHQWHQCFLLGFTHLNPLSVPHLINIQLSSDLNWMLWFHRPSGFSHKPTPKSTNKLLNYRYFLLHCTHLSCVQSPSVIPFCWLVDMDSQSTGSTGHCSMTTLVNPIIYHPRNQSTNHKRGAR